LITLPANYPLTSTTSLKTRFRTTIFKSPMTLHNFLLSLQTVAHLTFVDSSARSIAVLQPWATAEFFQGGKSRHFDYLLQIVDNATQMDVHKKTMSTVTSAVAYSIFPVRKLYTELWASEGFFPGGTQGDFSKNFPRVKRGEI